MKVLLLIPPTDIERAYGKLKKFSNPQPSIGIAYIASVLKANRYEVKVVDAYVNCYSLKELLGIIQEYLPEVIGISVLTPSAEVVCEISRNIRDKFPFIKIVMGNMHASLFSNELLSLNYADFIIHREGELTMLELVEVLSGNKDINKVNGISFKKEDAIVDNPQRPYIENLDVLPYPAWELFPIDRYSTDPRTEVKKGIVEMQILASRGCPNQCTFCSSRTEKSLGGEYRMRNPKSVVDEMVYMHDRFGAEVFSFMDLAFPLIRRHAVSLCEEMIGSGINKKINWFTECRVNSLDDELLMLMKEAGCVRVCFGIESGSDKILKLVKKNFIKEDVRKAVKMANKAGLYVDGMFMIGLPGETEMSINDTVNFAIELNIRYAIFNIFVPYPGCELFDILKTDNKIHYKRWSDFTSYPSYSDNEPVYAPDGLSKKRLMMLQKEAMKRFYFRFRFIMNEIKNFKTNKILHYVEGFRGVILTK